MLNYLYSKKFFFPIFSGIFSFLQIALIFLDDEDGYSEKKTYIIIIGLISIGISIIYIFLLNYIENKKRVIKSDMTKIICSFGDIFDNESCSLKVIPFEASYDLNCDPNRIPIKSIQAQFVTRMKKANKLEELQVCIDNPGSSKAEHGKIFIDNNNRYLIFPVAKLNQNGNAELSLLDYIRLINTLCETIEINSKKEIIVMPIIGAGISISNKSIDSYERLKFLLEYIKNYNFKKEITIKVIINPKHKNKKFNLTLL